MPFSSCCALMALPSDIKTVWSFGSSFTFTWEPISQASAEVLVNTTAAKATMERVQCPRKDRHQLATLLHAAREFNSAPLFEALRSLEVRSSKVLPNCRHQGCLSSHEKARRRKASLFVLTISPCATTTCSGCFPINSRIFGRALSRLRKLSR